MKPMTARNENIEKQLRKPLTWFCKYYPKRIINVDERGEAARQIVYEFKDGVAHEAVAQMTSLAMREQYGKACQDIVFMTLPASSKTKNEIRYKNFCQRVCELTGAINGYEHIQVEGNRLAIHENRELEKDIRKVNIIRFDEKWMRNKLIVIFDDAITKGISYANFANQLEALGAHVLGGIFLAKTHYIV